MARYIDADELVKFYESAIADEWNKKTAPISWADAYDNVIADIEDNIPTADVVEVKHGEWIYNTDDFTPKMRCSSCGYNKPLVAGQNIEQEPNDYCNKCGAKMDGGVNDG